MRRPRAIRRSVSSSVFLTIVHAFIFSHLDYCNSLYAGLSKTRFSSLQSVLNFAVRLISRLPRYSHISTLMTDVVLWLPVTYHVQYTVLLLVSRARFLNTNHVQNCMKFEIDKLAYVSCVIGQREVLAFYYTCLPAMLFLGRDWQIKHFRKIIKLLKQ